MGAGGADGTVSIELRLMTEKASSAMDSFVKQTKAKVPGVFGGKEGAAGTGADKEAKAAGTAMDTQTAKVVKLTAALKSQQAAALAAWRAQNPGGVAPGQKITTGPGMLARASVPGGPIPVGPVTGGGLATQPTAGLIPAIVAAVKNAGVPASVGTKPATTLSSMLSTAANAPLGKVAAAGAAATAALAGLRVAVGLASYAIRLLMIPVKMLFHAFMEAAEAARKLYARSLQSGGAPLQFNAWRGNLAQVIGVGENEVLQYGKAVGYVNGKLAWANRTMAATNTQLTASAWEWQVLKVNISALNAQIMSGLAPAFRGATATVNNLVVAMGKFTDVAMKAWKYIGFMSLLNPTSAIPWIAGKVFGSVSGPPAPEPEASARRYQSSPWERMGLVLGAGMGDNPAKKTASNTTKMVEQLNRMIDITRMTHPELYRQTSGASAS